MKNQSAFPVLDVHRCTGELGCTDTGMTLLDYFAGQALAGIIKIESDGRTECAKYGYNWDEFVSIECYRLAVAMLKERNRVLAELSAVNNNKGE